MVHQVVRFETREAFTMWEQEFREEEKVLRGSGLLSAPRIFTSKEDESVTIDLSWKTMDAARKYLSAHTYLSDYPVEKENPENLDNFISNHNYTMMSNIDRLRLRREGIVRLADRGVLFAADHKMLSPTTKLQYTALEHGVKRMDSGKIFTYEEADNNVKSLSREVKGKFLHNGTVRYFE